MQMDRVEVGVGVGDGGEQCLGLALGWGSCLVARATSLFIV